MIQFKLIQHTAIAAVTVHFYGFEFEMFAVDFHNTILIAGVLLQSHKCDFVHRTRRIRLGNRAGQLCILAKLS